MTYLKLSLLSFSLAAFMFGCSQDSSNSDPLVPEIESITIEGTHTIHSVAIASDDLQLIGRINYTDNTSSITYVELDWESNDTSVVLVHNGLLAATGNGGVANISASYRNKVYTIEKHLITIVAISDINITSNNLNITYDDTNASKAAADLNNSHSSKSWQLTINGTFTDKNTTTISSNIGWTSSNATIASVDGGNFLYYKIEPDINTIIEINASVFTDIKAVLDLNISVP